MQNNPLFYNNPTQLQTPVQNLQVNPLLYNDPTVAAQQVQQVNAQPAYTGEWAETKRAISNVTPSQVFNAALNNINQMGTGLQTAGLSLLTLPSQLYNYAVNTSDEQKLQDLKNAGQYAANTVTMPYRTIGNLLTGDFSGALNTINDSPSLPRDAWNLMFGQYGIGTDRMASVASGEITPDQYYAGIVEGVSNNPVSLGLDLISAGGATGAGKAIGKSLQKAGKKVNASIVKNLDVKTPTGELITSFLPDFSNNSGKVSNVIAEARQKGASKAGVVSDKINESLAGLSKQEAELVIKSAEQGIELTDPKLIAAKDKLKTAMNLYDDMIPENAKVPQREIAVTQKYARDNNITYEEAKRELTALEERISTVSDSTSDSRILGTKPEDYINVFKKITQGKEANLPKIIDKTDVEKVASASEDASKFINIDATIAAQPQRVKDIISDVTGLDLTLADNTPVREVLDILNRETGSVEATSKLLKDAGLEGYISGNKTTLFGGKAKGGYNRADNTITYYRGSDINTSIHEPFHWFIDKLVDESATNSKIKNYLKSSTGTDLTDIKNNSALYRDFQENLTNEYIRFVNGNVENLTPAKRKFFNFIRQNLKNEIPNNSRISRLENLAAKGDTTAQQVLNSEKLFDSGKIFPVTHSGDEALRTIEGTLADDTSRYYAGRYSSREFGNATYGELVDRLFRNEKWLDDKVFDFAENKIIDDILNTNSLGGEKLANNLQDVLYLDRNKLKEGNLRGALRTAKAETPKDLERFVPVERGIAKELENQLYNSGSPLRGILADMSSAIRTSMLSQGLYLAGNAITGGTNAIINSSVNLLNDIGASIATRGKLARELGLSRVDKARKMQTPVGEIIQDINLKTGGNLLRYLDRNIQNAFAEIAANAELRKQGVPVANRIDAVNKLDFNTLSDTINNVRSAALLNNPRTIVPRGAYPFLEVVQPFWRWYDTATQSSYSMLKNHPLMANMFMVDFMSNIGWNTEMQNRYNLRVESDRPMVSYKFDPKTKKVMELSGDIVPMMATLRFFSNTGRVIQGKEAPDTLMPAGWADIINATQGMDRYGNKLKNAAMVVQANKRYKLNETTGQWEEVKGGTPSEVLISTVRTLFGVPNMVNKTLAPAVTGLLNSMGGTQYNYYRPYAGSLFGEIVPEGQMPSEPNILVGGNPTSQRTAKDLMNAISGMYTTEYYPERPNAVNSERQLMNILRARARRDRNIQESISR